MNNTNNISAEMAFEKAKRLFYLAMRDKFTSDEACWDWVNARKFSQSEIRLECEMQANKTNFMFGLTDNQKNSTGVLFNTENRLTMQDSLVCNEMGIYVCKPSSRTATDFQLRTYGNTQDFTAGAAASIDSQFYDNGAFQIQCNNDVVYPYRGLWNHKYRGQTQQTAALGAGSPGDQIRGAEDGMITMQPNILLIGSKGYIPQIVLPDSLATVDAFSRIVLIFRGVLAQNSTSVS